LKCPTLPFLDAATTPNHRLAKHRPWSPTEPAHTELSMSTLRYRVAAHCGSAEDSKSIGQGRR
jgi:hypothetical protein